MTKKFIAWYSRIAILIGDGVSVYHLRLVRWQRARKTSPACRMARRGGSLVLNGGKLEPLVWRVRPELAEPFDTLLVREGHTHTHHAELIKVTKILPLFPGGRLDLDHKNCPTVSGRS